MEKIIFTNNQIAFEYVAYMIIGSYFQKTICRKRLLEQKMRLQYLEQRLESQLQLEERCIFFTENHLKRELPPDIWNETMEVHFVPDPWGLRHELRFNSPHYMLRIQVVYLEKYKCKIDFDLRMLSAA
ncbi:MAG: hypothetical protein PHP50_08270 [Lachnospiraceae bacterium]|nr:hypothetical protein [Lachnospiraceae bacterium]